MPENRDFHVYIEVDGQPLPEFRQVVESDGKRLTCFIPSKRGKEYRICVKNKTKYLDKSSIVASANVYIDGTWADSLLFSTSESESSLDGFPTSVDKERPFVFTDVQLEERSGTLTQGEKEASKHISTIRVETCFATGLRESSPFIDPVPEAKGVHEKLKKGGGHCTSYGPEKTVPEQNWSHYDVVDALPVVDFVFHYASEDWLQAKEIMPLPERLQNRQVEYDSDMDCLDDDEVDEYLELKKKMEKYNKRFAARRVKPDPDSQGSEVGPSRSRRSVFRPREVIDLTMD